MSARSGKSAKSAISATDFQPDTDRSKDTVQDGNTHMSMRENAGFTARDIEAKMKLGETAGPERPSM